MVLHLPLLLGGDLKELYDGLVPKAVSEIHLDSSVLDLGPPTSLVCQSVELELPSEAEYPRDGDPRHGHPGGEHPAVPAVLHVGVHEPEFLERRKSDSRISQRVAWAKHVGTNVDLVLRKENSGTRGLREIDSWFEGNNDPLQP
jgi:hypothetical protein